MKTLKLNLKNGGFKAFNIQTICFADGMISFQDLQGRQYSYCEDVIASLYLLF